MVRVLSVGVVCALCVMLLVACDKDPVGPSSLASVGSAALPQNAAASFDSTSGSGSSSSSSSGSSSSGSSSSGASPSSPSPPSPSPNSSPNPAPYPLPVPLPAVTGSIVTLAGSCPNLAFTVGAKAIVTNQSTTFGGGQCSAFKIGDVVTAQGNVNADGSMVAQQVTKQ